MAFDFADALFAGISPSTATYLGVYNKYLKGDEGKGGYYERLPSAQYVPQPGYDQFYPTYDISNWGGQVPPLGQGTWVTGETFPTGFNVPSDAYPRSGLPDYANDTLRGVLQNYPDFTQGLADATTRLATAGPGMIEPARQAMLEGYWNEVPAFMEKNVGNALTQAGQRGVLSSTVMQNALQGIGQEVARGGQKAETEANRWAAEKLYQNLLDTVSAYGKQGELAGNLMGAGRETTDKWTPIRDVLAMMMGG